ncbi:MAG: hypothetical protein EOM28_03990 [Clostridia bacterium]|nr:hypothetical protein [Clostridia bacterium]
MGKENCSRAFCAAAWRLSPVCTSTKVTFGSWVHGEGQFYRRFDLFATVWRALQRAKAACFCCIGKTSFLDTPIQYYSLFCHRGFFTFYMIP